LNFRDFRGFPDIVSRTGEGRGFGQDNFTLAVTRRTTS
jgi:hypothetical protein